MVFDKIRKYGEMVMFSHTLFSLPFALISMFWAAKGFPAWTTFLWIIVALFGARNGANALNRVIDADIDRKNPRTAGRHIPKGEVKKSEALLVVIVCFAVMVFAAYMLNPLCLILSPAALAIFIFYSYTKRFTWLCHFVLGVACGGAPVGAWIAVTGKIEILPIALGAAVTFWIAGFDIIYATQDYDFDRENNLFSVPAVFGIKNSLIISAFFHVLSVLILIWIKFQLDLSAIYTAGIVVISILLISEHIIVSPKNLKTMKIASYSINQIVSVVFFIFSFADVLIRWII